MDFQFNLPRVTCKIVYNFFADKRFNLSLIWTFATSLLYREFEAEFKAGKETNEPDLIKFPLLFSIMVYLIIALVEFKT